MANSVPNSLHVFEQNLLTAAVIELRRPAIGVAGDTLSGFKGAVIFQKIGDACRPERVRRIMSWESSLLEPPLKHLRRVGSPEMLKRRLKQAGLPAHYSPHSFRATGITNFLENDGTLEAAQRIAGHADSRTTKLY